MSVRDVMRESNRCARNVELGGSIDFWITRISRRVAELDAEASILNAKLDELRKQKAAEPGLRLLPTRQPRQQRGTGGDDGG